MEAEIRTLAEYLSFCTRMGINNIDIESDSPTTKNFLNSRKGHWKISQEIDYIASTIRATNNKFSHIFRKINSVVDYLANYAVENDGDFSMAHSFSPLK